MERWGVRGRDGEWDEEVEGKRVRWRGGREESEMKRWRVRWRGCHLPHPVSIQLHLGCSRTERVQTASPVWIYMMRGQRSGGNVLKLWSILMTKGQMLMVFTFDVVLLRELGPDWLLKMFPSPSRCLPCLHACRGCWGTNPACSVTASRTCSSSLMLNVWSFSHHLETIHSKLVQSLF